MIKQSKISTYTFIITCVIMCVCFLCCKNDIAVVESLTTKEKFPDETSEKIHLILSTQAKLNYEFFFERLNHFSTPEKYYEAPEGLKIISFNDFGEKNMTLTADYGINYEGKQLMEAKRNVVITNHQTQEIIEAEHMIWDMATHSIYSKGQIKQTKADGSVYIGDAFEADEKMEKYEVTNPKIIFYTEED